MISVGWSGTQQPMLMNAKWLLKLIMMRELLTSSHFDQQEKKIARSSTIKYCWNSSWWQIFWNGHTWLSSKRTPGFCHTTNSVEFDHGEGNFKMTALSETEKENPTLATNQNIAGIYNPDGKSQTISFRSTAKRNPRFANDEILLKITMIRQIQK